MAIHTNNNKMEWERFVGKFLSVWKQEILSSLMLGREEETEKSAISLGQTNKAW